MPKGLQILEEIHLGKLMGVKYFKVIINNGWVVIIKSSMGYFIPCYLGWYFLSSDEFLDIKGKLAGQLLLFIRILIWIIIWE